MRRRRGLTLIELLLSMAMMGLVLAGAVHAMVAGLRVEERLRDGTRREERIGAFERDLTSIISQAYLSSDTTVTSSYFFGTTGEGLSTGIQQGQSATQSATTDELTFTSVGMRPSGAVLDSTQDFETTNERYGAHGGVGEYCISMTGYDAPSDAQGLFVRVQRPADGDPTQGGRQMVLSADVREIRFEFYDGTEWISTWDTRSETTPRLPAAVRVYYRLDGENGERIVTIRMVHSDVTPTNPVTVGGG
jgi:prepilin-type N-terminal cleavage/methylation domain-containing protein